LGVPASEALGGIGPPTPTPGVVAACAVGDAAGAPKLPNSSTEGLSGAAFAGSPWEGFEDIAREDLVEWMVDFASGQREASMPGPARQPFAGGEEERLRGVLESLLGGPACSLCSSPSSLSLRGWGGCKSADAKESVRSSLETASTMSSLRSSCGTCPLTAASTRESLAASLGGTEWGEEQGSCNGGCGGGGGGGAGAPCWELADPEQIVQLRGWGPPPQASSGPQACSTLRGARPVGRTGYPAGPEATATAPPPPAAGAHPAAGTPVALRAPPTAAAVAAGTPRGDGAASPRTASAQPQPPDEVTEWEFEFVLRSAMTINAWGVQRVREALPL